MNLVKDPDFGRSVFVCSKPLQFYNCVSLIRSYGIIDPVIYVVTTGLPQWEDFKGYIHRSIFYGLFEDVIFISEHKLAAKTIADRGNYESLFIECDRVNNYKIYAPLKKKYLSVFEEGFGTYSGGPDGSLYVLKLVKWWVSRALYGSGAFFGGGRKTDYIFVSNPSLYRKLNPKAGYKARWIPGVMSEVKQCDELASLVRDMNLPINPDTRLALIVGTWGGARGLEKSLVSRYDLVIYKPHPHDNIDIVADRVVSVKKSWIPVEVIIGMLALDVENLTVYHFSSSAAFYCGEIKNIKFVDLQENKRFVSVVGAS